MTDVFISYADEDARRVRRIVDGFQAAGVAAFFERESRDGVLWMDATAAQIKQSDAIVVVLSNEAAQSERMAWEVDLAARYGKRLFPAVLEKDAPIPQAFTEAVERRRDVYEDPAGARAVQVAEPIGLWRDEPIGPATTKSQSTTAEPTLRPAGPSSPLGGETAAGQGDAPKTSAASDLAADMADRPAGVGAAPEAAPTPATTNGRSLDGEKIRRLVNEVRKATDAARVGAEGPRTTEGLAKSASLVFAQWRAVEDSDDLRRLKTFRSEFADDPYFSERADDRIELLRRDAIWGRVDFGFRLVTGMALVAVAVWALRETDELKGVYSTFAGSSRPAATSTAASGGAGTSGGVASSDAQLRILQLQKQVQLERDRAAELQKMLDGENPDVAKLQASLTAAEGRASKLDQSLAAARAETRELQLASAKAERQVAQARKATVAAAEARDKAEAESRRLRNARDQALIERDAAKAAIGDSGDAAQLSAVASERDRLRADLTSAKRRLATLERQLDDANSDRTRLAGQVEELKASAARAETTGYSAAQIPAGGVLRSGSGSAILMSYFLDKQERIYSARQKRDGVYARFPIMSRRDIQRMQVCIEKTTSYRVGADGIWGLRTSRAVMSMTSDQARGVTDCLTE